MATSKSFLTFTQQVTSYGVSTQLEEYCPLPINTIKAKKEDAALKKANIFLFFYHCCSSSSSNP